MKSIETIRPWRNQGRLRKGTSVLCLLMMTSLCSCASSGRFAPSNFALSNPFKRTPKTENVVEEKVVKEEVKTESKTASKPTEKIAEFKPTPHQTASLASMTRKKSDNSDPFSAFQNEDPFDSKIKQVSNVEPVEKAQKATIEEPMAVKKIARIGMPTKQSIEADRAKHKLVSNYYVTQNNTPGTLPSHQINLATNDWPQIPDPRIPEAQLKKLNSPERIADEYLFDGGDRKMGVHFSPYSTDGLNTEDTVAIYTDSQGKRIIKPSNRVAIYSPRFAAVRSISEPITANSINKVAGAFDSIKSSGINNKLGPTMEQQNLQLRHARVRSRASAYDSDNNTRNIDQVAKSNNHTKLTNTYQGLGTVGSKSIAQKAIERTARQIQGAFTWTRDQNPAITASTVGGQVLISKFREEEYVGLEINKKPGKLKIIKLADKQTAERGDIITFTIQYANYGERPLVDVQVIDNLTGRLEFIEGSASSDRIGSLSVEDNKEGSLILQWDIKEPLKGGEHGIVTFKTRVR